MTTFGDLVTQVNSLLHSYTGVVEPSTHLTAGCNDTDLSLTVADSNQVSNGIIQVEEELMFTTASDAGAVTIAPYGRGFQGSTAVAHSANVQVVSDPVFPIVEIKRALNQVLASVYPMLYQVKTTTLTFTAAVATYELPADVGKVLKVTYEATGPSAYWPTILGWEFEPNSSVTNGKAITFLEAPEPGRSVRITYQANFTQFAANSDTCASIGFPESAIDVLLYGATAKLIRFLDAARLQLRSVENISRAQNQIVQVGDAGKLANQLYAMFKTRLDEERKRLLDLTPPTMHFTR